MRDKSKYYIKLKINVTCFFFDADVSPAESNKTFTVKSVGTKRYMRPSAGLRRKYNIVALKAKKNGNQLKLLDIYIHL